MTCTDVRNRFDEWLDGALPAEEQDQLHAHVAACAACAAELETLSTLRRISAALPREIEPDTDLWPGIAARIDGERAHPDARRPRLPRWNVAGYAWRLGVVAAAIALGVVGAREWRARVGTGAQGWEVTALSGTPVLGTRDVTAAERLRSGEWLRTDAESRARLSVPDVGRVDVGPRSAVRLLEANEREQRIELAEGRVSAFIWAPPRLFFVETPSGVVEDLGCRYDLIVDKNGNGTLDVTLGFVSFDREGSEVIVPEGASCDLRAHAGPGTPHAVNTSAELHAALTRFDFEGRPGEALAAVLNAATATDAVTLWHLFPRVEAADRARVFDRLAVLVPPPDGVTREAVLSLERKTLERWWVAIYPRWTLWN